MWIWLLISYSAFLITIGAGSTIVALMVPEVEKDRRKIAFGIVKLVLGTGTGLTSATIVAVRLHTMGMW